MVLQRGLHDGGEGLAHFRLEPLVDFLLRPEIAVAVLDPLEVRRGDAGAVREDVGDDEDAVLVQVAMRFGLGRAVGAFDHDLRADRRRVAERDLVLERRGDEDVDVQREELLVGERLRARETVHGVVLLRVLEQLRDVEAGGVVDAALPVGDGDDAGADAGEELRRNRADVAESLDGDGGPVDVEAHVLGRLARDDHHAAAGRLVTAERAAHFERLPRHHRRRRVSDVHAVGVHDPRHHLLVGVDVGSGDVLFGTDGVDDFGNVAARERFELAPRHLGRIADDPALAAAERDVRDGALPRHPAGERRHFVERDARVVAEAALRGAERDVVLHPVAGEDLDLAVVHLHRATDGDLSLGVGEDLPDAGVEIENAGGDVELLEHVLEQRSLRLNHARRV